MNNNQMNFDPMTGQPLNNNVVQPTVTPVAPVQQVMPTPEVTPVQQVPTQANIIQENTPILNQQQMQNIPTVEQTKQQFIDNTQANSSAKIEEKKEGPNIAFIVILFIIIFAAIFFLFPYLIKVL